MSNIGIVITQNNSHYVIVQNVQIFDSFIRIIAEYYSAIAAKYISSF